MAYSFFTFTSSDSIPMDSETSSSPPKSIIPFVGIIAGISDSWDVLFWGRSDASVNEAIAETVEFGEMVAAGAKATGEAT